MFHPYFKLVMKIEMHYGCTFYIYVFGELGSIAKKNQIWNVCMY